MEAHSKSKKNIKKKQIYPNLKPSSLISGTGKKTPVPPLSGLLGVNVRRSPH